jgi:hypothetical protein
MLIMVDVLEIEGAIFSVLEPFLSWLITTDIEIPCDLRDKKKKTNRNWAELSKQEHYLTVLLL